jgi:hypothetical protein
MVQVGGAGRCGDVDEGGMENSTSRGVNCTASGQLYGNYLLICVEREILNLDCNGVEVSDGEYSWAGQFACVASTARL